MSTQVTVRLPDDLVEFVDHMVSEGRGKSRAEIVSRAIERARRREAAERDAAILARAGADCDMDSLVQHVADLPIDLE